ncbi:MAG: hypothetical protein FD168_1169 [Desulfobulbaceae bacterium]|nr:MAG: hypothetical protein FD168_1169 [Desulfobulbaceae bacterium]
MKILIVGDWHSELHEEAVSRALVELGHSVERFPWHKYFTFSTGSIFSHVVHLWRRVQNKYLWGPNLTRLNSDLIDIVRRDQPKVVFVYRGTHIFSKTLYALRKVAPDTVLVGYNNDNPFTVGHTIGLWRHFIAGLPALDLALAYRHANLNDFSNAGAQRTELLRSWYVPERNRYVRLSNEELEQFSSDVVFAGHYEPDMRLACLEEVVRRGWRLRIFGHTEGWKQALESSPILRHINPVYPMWNDDYNRALCGARVALCFLSKLNQDTYTRRCFEIPASGTLMLSEYSDDLASMFAAGVETDYFRSPQELGEKLDYYLHNEQKRISVANAGQKRLLQDKHDVVSRMQQVVGWIEEIRGSN